MSHPAANGNPSENEVPRYDINMLEQLIEAAPIAVVTVDRTGAIHYVNARLESMFGYDRGELLGQPVELLMPEKFRTIHQSHRSDYMAHPRVRGMGSGMDLVGRRKDGSEFPLEAGLSYVQIGDEMLVMGSITDITRRKQTEEMLEQRVEERTREIERRRSVAEGLRYILAVLNSDQTLQETLEYTVSQACRLLDAAACVLYQFNDEAGSLSVRAQCHLLPELCSRADVPIGLTADGKSVLHQPLLAVSDIATQHTSVPAVRKQQKLLLEHGYRALLAVRLMVKDMLYGGLTLYYTRPREFSAEDTQIAVTVGGHAALAIENDRLRSRAEQNAVQAERGRIARDLHDSVTQTLFSANIIAEVLPVLQERQPEEGTRRAQELQQLTRGALAEMRTLLLELRPNTLEKVGLDELLRQLVDATIARARIDVELHIEGSTDVSTDVKTVFFYVAQEALNNVVKHARATQAAVLFHNVGEMIQLTISDDGVGFAPEDVPPNHLGLDIMRERTSATAMELSVQSQPGEGTRVVTTWRSAP